MEVANIAFSSLLIGLMVGTHTVSVETAPGLKVASVEYLLDGERASTIPNGPPWQSQIDFGNALRSHRLIAIARAANGLELGRALRLVNLPQGPARLEIVVGHDLRGRPTTAKVIATSTLGVTAIACEAAVDGVPLKGQGSEFPLPKLDMTRPHTLTAVAEFWGGVTARADVAIGGGVQEEAGSRLTALPVRILGRALPPMTVLASALRFKSGVMPTVVTVERGSATVLIVRHPSALAAERRLRQSAGSNPLVLEDRDKVGFVWPIERKLPGGSDQSSLLEATPLFPGSRGGFYYFLTRISRVSGPSSQPPYRFIDAVAVAGLQLFGTGTRRAIVLVQGPGDGDASELTPKQVRPYLDELGVPLHVWSLGTGTINDWEVETEDISSNVGLQVAVARLKKDLGSQAIVWIAGECSPGEVEASADEPNFSLLCGAGSTF